MIPQCIDSIFSFLSDIHCIYCCYSRLEFYVSFKSDGVTSYTNNTEDNVIIVYANPDFIEFDPLVRRYDPNANNPRITIQVRHIV